MRCAGDKYLCKYWIRVFVQVLYFLVFAYVLDFEYLCTYWTFSICLSIAHRASCAVQIKKISTGALRAEALQVRCVGDPGFV